MSGAHDRTRTGDPVLTKNVLYLLSYVGAVVRLEGWKLEDGGSKVARSGLSTSTL